MKETTGNNTTESSKNDKDVSEENHNVEKDCFHQFPGCQLQADESGDFIDFCMISEHINESSSFLEHHGQEEQEQLPASPPEFTEGGWGWVIVVACFFNSFILDGIGSSFGVLYPYVHEEFNASAFVTSFAGSMFGAYLIMGSIAAFLIKKIGFRAVSFTGGVFSCIGLVAASYSSNIYLFLLSYGVIGGAAVGLVYLPSMVIVNGYFNKRRGITNGIISSGSGVGLLVMAPVTNALLDKFSLNGTLLILAGVLLNICVFSCCFRNPTIYQSGPSTQDGKDKKHGEIDCEETTEESSLNSFEHIHPVTEQIHTIDDSDLQHTNEIVKTCPPVVIKHVDDSHSDVNKIDSSLLSKKDKFLFHQLRSNRSLVSKLPSHDASSKHSLHSFQSNCPNTRQKHFIHHSTYALAENKLHPNSTVNQSSKSSHSLYGIKNNFERLISPGGKHEIKASSSMFTDIGVNSYLTSSISRLMEIHNQYFASTHQLENTELKSDHVVISNTDEINPCKDSLHLPKDSKYFTSHTSVNTQTTQDDISLSDDVTNNTLGYSIGQLLRMFPFHLFCLGACLIQFGYPVPGIFLADLAASHGISAQFGAIMISLIGSFNVIGRLLGGALANLNFNPLRLNNISMLVAAVLCFLCPLFSTPWSLCIFASLYGFLLGFFPPLQPLIIVKYFGIGSLASTFGFVTTLKGFAGLIGPPLAGWIYDMSHDYSISIVFAGVAFLLSVVINEILVHTIDSKLK